MADMRAQFARAWVVVDQLNAETAGWGAGGGAAGWVPMEVRKICRLAELNNRLRAENQTIGNRMKTL